MKYKVPFVNYPKQYQNLKFEIDEAFYRIMSHGNFILRDDVEQFEQRMADYLGVEYCVGLNSGTDALYLSLLAHGIKQGDEVITVAHTFLATVGAVVNCGATPVLIDVGRDYNMDVSQIESAITPRTKAIIPVHLNGRMSNMGEIVRIATEHNLIIIEDSAQSLGANFSGMKVYETACYSFYPAKILGCAGDGGMVATDLPAIATLLRALRDNGRVRGSDYVNGYGFNSRLDNLQAAILNMKMDYLDVWIQRRRIIAGMYDRGLLVTKGIKLPPLLYAGSVYSGTPYFDVYQNYVIRSRQRDELRQYLADKGIETLVSWIVPMHKQKSLKLGHFNLSETEAISREVLSLPMYPELEDWQVEYVIKAIKEFYA